MSTALNPGATQSLIEDIVRFRGPQSRDQIAIYIRDNRPDIWNEDRRAAAEMVALRKLVGRVTREAKNADGSPTFVHTGTLDENEKPQLTLWERATFEEVDCHWGVKFGKLKELREECIVLARAINDRFGRYPTGLRFLPGAKDEDFQYGDGYAH